VNASVLHFSSILNFFFPLFIISRYKDGEVKRMVDPLATMKAYLSKREQAHEAARRRAADPWSATPSTERDHSSTPVPSLLGPRRPKRRRSASPPPPKRQPSAERERQVAPLPNRPRVTKAKEEEARDREGSERARAKALLSAAKKKRKGPTSDFNNDESASVRSTPARFGNQYNPSETKLAKRRWDEDTEGRRRRWPDDDEGRRRRHADDDDDDDDRRRSDKRRRYWG
jgi:hypothetical protein